jgi:hypothetical protein
MIFRKFGLGAVIISLALLLSSCTDVIGNMSVNSAARFNGEITYTIDKSFLSAAGFSNLAQLNEEASKNTEEQVSFCKDVPFTEDSSNYILKCPFKDELSETGELTASIVNKNVVLLWKSNLEESEGEGEQTNFGSVSLTIKFLDPVISFKENKVGLFKKIDDVFRFTRDVCASKDNYKCLDYWTEEENCLDKVWDGVNWMNPPYKNMKKFIQKNI